MRYLIGLEHRLIAVQGATGERLMPHSPEHMHKGSAEARNEPVWRANDYNSISGSYQYRDSATPITDVAHEADPDNVPPAQLHVTHNWYAGKPVGWGASVQRGDLFMRPGTRHGSFRTENRARIAAEAMMNRINKHGDDRYDMSKPWPDDEPDPF